MRIIDIVSFTKSIKTVPLPWMHGSCQFKCIQNRTNSIYRRSSVVEQLQFMIEKANIEGGIVNDQFGATDE